AHQLLNRLRQIATHYRGELSSRKGHHYQRILCGKTKGALNISQNILRGANFEPTVSRILFTSNARKCIKLRCFEILGATGICMLILLRHESSMKDNCPFREAGKDNCG